MQNLFWSELKQLFTYSPIHLLGTPKSNKTVPKLSTNNEQVHRFQRSGNKSENGRLPFWSELKQLFTYSPIHLFGHP